MSSHDPSKAVTQQRTSSSAAEIATPAKATPGPWKTKYLLESYARDRVGNIRSGSPPYISAEGVNGAIAEPYSNGKTDDEINANARLIAKAPEMYELLHVLVRLDDLTHPDEARRARALLEELDS